MATVWKVSRFLKKIFDYRNCIQTITAVRLYTDEIHSSYQSVGNLGKDLSQCDREPDIEITGSGECSMPVYDSFDDRPSLSNLQITEEDLSQYPIERFTGSIYVVKEPSDERGSEILDVLDRLKKERVLGFDVEMSESRRLDGSQKRSKKTRVVQIASETDALVWQLKNFSSLPSSLVFFLESDILKVGHAISDDVVLLKKEFNIKSRNLFDTLPWAMQLNCKPLGLHALCAIFLGWRISKGLRTSDWNRKDLSENQIHYACTDAWASLMVYKKMKSVAYKNGNVLPLPIGSVNDILDTRLMSKRKRRSRHVQNYKARKNFNSIVETAMKVVE